MMGLFIKDAIFLYKVTKVTRLLQHFDGFAWVGWKVYLEEMPRIRGLHTAIVSRIRVCRKAEIYAGRDVSFMS